MGSTTDCEQALMSFFEVCTSESEQVPMSALGQYPVFEEDQSSFLLSKTRPHSNVRNEDCCLAMTPLRLTTASKWYRGQEALLVSPLQVHFSFREALRSHFASRKIGETLRGSSCHAGVVPHTSSIAKNCFRIELDRKELLAIELDLSPTTETFLLVTA